jgi:hypothetical protein
MTIVGTDGCKSARPFLPGESDLQEWDLKEATPHKIQSQQKGRHFDERSLGKSQPVRTTQPGRTLSLRDCPLTSSPTVTLWACLPHSRLHLQGPGPWRTVEGPGPAPKLL